MTADEFRKLALSLPEAIEGAHMGHADFRVGNRIFATLGWPDEHWGMVKLTPEEQELRVEAEPDVFAPVKGAWGRRGSTNVRLRGERGVAGQRASGGVAGHGAEAACFPGGQLNLGCRGIRNSAPREVTRPS